MFGGPISQVEVLKIGVLGGRSKLFGPQGEAGILEFSVLDPMSLC